MRPLDFRLPIILTAALLLALPARAENAALLGTFGDWEAYKETEGGKTVCYMGSQPTKARGKYKKRGETFILVTHRPAEKTMNVISINAGYTYQKASEVDAVIGKQTFKLFTDAGHAFAYDQKTDDALVKAMVKGAQMVIKGTSSRGTRTTDTYSLKGVTAAHKAIGKACKVK